MRVLSADFYVRYGGGMLIADAVLGRLLIYARFKSIGLLWLISPFTAGGLSATTAR